jgi:hypothetical protein
MTPKTHTETPTCNFHLRFQPHARIGGGGKGSGVGENGEGFAMNDLDVRNVTCHKVLKTCHNFNMQASYLSPFGRLIAG